MTNSSMWQWRETEKGRFLTCDLLRNWQHGFFTCHFQGDSPNILVGYLNPNASVYRLKQIHSDILFSTATLDRHYLSGADLLEGDGIISSKSLDSVWCASADCTPVLIADKGTGGVMAIHSGWRGTSTAIVPKAIALLQSQGAKLEDLLFALGPAIHGKVYQVNEEVAVEVLKTIFPSDTPSELIIEKALQIENQPILPDEEENKVRLNVTQVISLQIQQQGINLNQIAIAPYCTYQTPEDFFSYRRTKEKKIQWSGIVSH
ncbi:peptidoglycan editing factor PgeF [Cyanobacterium aponinum AL20118]|uniref:Purine nucleoside phosphorylase n=1 Tax=Cyanobacterium aponinum AL20115 TaxID=3090662 RepID=A0AAF0ZAL3_9CHRO|nr:peptidoglycan editing factor PgeF [Cyanobacterium aponinum]WPF89491.1 peptidoglycan editing factor PgeF [Cyanobacterium aponinum AL20115]